MNLLRLFRQPPFRELPFYGFNPVYASKDVRSNLKILTVPSFSDSLWSDSDLANSRTDIPTSNRSSYSLVYLKRQKEKISHKNVLKKLAKLIRV